MTVIQNGEDYEKYFDPERYLTHCYSESGKYPDTMHFMTKTLHKIFADGFIKGEDLLDIGSGPTIHSVISASSYFDNIYLCDYAEQNLDILKSWRKSERPLQENMIQEVCELENKGESLANRVDRIRNKVKGIFHLDITNLDSLKQTEVPQNYDVITSCYCLDAAVTTREGYSRCVNNVKTLLKSGGYFVTIGDLEDAVFHMDNITFKGVFLNSMDLKAIYSEAGFEFKLYREYTHATEGNDFIIIAKRID